MLEPGTPTLRSLLDVEVNVKRQDTSSEVVPLGEEFERFLVTNFPGWEARQLRVPDGFEFDEKKLKHTEGLVDFTTTTTTRQRDWDEWLRVARAELGESTAFKLAQISFSGEASTIISGFKEKDFRDVMKKTLLYQYKHHLESPLAPLEREFYSKMLYRLDLDDLESKISQWCDLAIYDDIDIVDQLLTAIDSMKGKERKPGLDQLSERQKKNYKRDLKSKLQETINKQQAGSKFSKKEVNSFFLRHLMAAASENYNSEFDTLVILKNAQRLVHIEVKTYPQNNEPVEEQKLSEVFRKTEEQLAKGEEMFNSMIFPLADCPSWRHTAIFFFPQIESRKVFDEKLNLSQAKLQQIITKAELEDKNWTIQMSFSEEAWSGGGGEGGDDENCLMSYKRLISLMLGSHYVNFYSQSYSPQDKIRKDLVRIVGERTPLLPHSEFPARGEEVKFSELRRKPLGHISSILFNTPQQKALLDSLHEREPTVILGNYGTGKTVVFQTAARKFDSDADLKVHFISAIDFEYDGQYYKISDDIMDLQLREGFRNSGITVTSVGKLRRETRNLRESAIELIRKYSATLNHDSVLIIDELELTESDKRRITDGEKCELVGLLEELKQRQILTWTVIGVSSLLECSERAEGSVKTFIKFLSKGWRNVDCELTESRLSDLLSSAGYKVIKLKQILRNSQAVAELADDMRSIIASNVHFGGGGDVTGPSLLSVSGQCSTVPGSRPVCLLYNNGFLHNYILNSINYWAVSGAIMRYLRHLNINPAACGDKIVILLSNNISTHRLHSKLPLDNVILYDGGVDMFSDHDLPRHYNISQHQLDQQEEAALSWLHNGGILLTHAAQFRGCEASNVILVTNYTKFSPLTTLMVLVVAALVGSGVGYWGGAGLWPGLLIAGIIIVLQMVYRSRLYGGVSSNYRSNITRAVAGMALVIVDRRFTKDKLRKYFDVLES